MDCNCCKNTITPGMAIVVDEYTGERAHCPYCLEPLQFGSPSSSSGVEKDCPDKRTEMRRTVREKFLKRLVEQSDDGQLHCPICAHKLNKNDQRLLLEEEYFRCHFCGHDLANYAYREEAYHEQRWLPVVYALTDLIKEEECRDCSRIRAIAKACRKAFSWMPGSELEQHSRLNRVLRHSHWKDPSCDPDSCVAVRQYRNLAGEGLLLL